MAMLNWQGWAATNFVGWGSAGSVTPPQTNPYPGPAGSAGKAKRRKVEIDGQLYNLTPAELETALETVLRREPVKDLPKPVQKPARALQKAVEATPEPKRATYPSVPAFDALWADLMRKEQHALAAQAREVAQRIEIEQDDADIFALVRMIEDDDT